VNDVDFDHNEDDLDLKNLIDRTSPVKSEPETQDYGNAQDSGALLDLTLVYGRENKTLLGRAGAFRHLADRADLSHSSI